MSVRDNARLADSLNRSLDKKERVENIVKLRAYGFTVRSIAQSLGMKRSTVGDIVKGYCREMRDQSPEERRAEEFELVAVATNQVGESLFPHMLGSTGASPRVQVAAGHAILKVLEARRKLFGLDSPERVSVDVAQPTPAADWNDRLRDRMFAIAPGTGADGALCTILGSAIASRNIREGCERPEDQAALTRGRDLLQRTVESFGN